MFPTKEKGIEPVKLPEIAVAIPSNRVNVSYAKGELARNFPFVPCRNPLESGQCFSPLKEKGLLT